MLTRIEHELRLCRAELNMLQSRGGKPTDDDALAHMLGDISLEPSDVSAELIRAFGHMAMPTPTDNILEILMTLEKPGYTWEKQIFHRDVLKWNPELQAWHWVNDHNGCMARIHVGSKIVLHHAYGEKRYGSRDWTAETIPDVATARRQVALIRDMMKPPKSLARHTPY